LVGAVQVQENHEIMLISDQGTLVRTKVSGVSTLGRNTQGVTLIKVQKGESLVGVAAILDADDDFEGLALDSDESSTTQSSDADEIVGENTTDSASNEPSSDQE